MQLLQTVFQDNCIMICHLIVGVTWLLTAMIVHYVYSCSTAVCTCLLTMCAIQAILFIYSIAVMSNLMKFHDAVISEHCSGVNT